MISNVLLLNPENFKFSGFFFDFKIGFLFYNFEIARR